MLVTSLTPVTNGEVVDDIQPLRDAVGVGRRVRALREARSVEQADLADRAELSRAYISRLENGGITNPKLYDLARVARVLGTTVAHLIEPTSPDTTKLRAELEAVIEPSRAALLDDVVAEIKDWPEADQQFVLELFRRQVFNWPGLPERKPHADREG